MLTKKPTKSMRWAIIFLVLIGVVLTAADCQETRPTEGPAQARNTDSDNGNSSGFEKPKVEEEDGPSGDTAGVLYSKRWNDLLNNENFGLLLNQTEEVIALGPNTDFYAQARLYHGLALLSMNENTETAKEDLQAAEQLEAELGANKDLLLLGQVLLFDKLGELDQAERYRERAINEIQNPELLKNIQLQNLQTQPAKIIINDQLKLQEFRQQE